MLAGLQVHVRTRRRTQQKGDLGSLPTVWLSPGALLRTLLDEQRRITGMVVQAMVQSDSGPPSPSGRLWLLWK